MIWIGVYVCFVSLYIMGWVFNISICYAQTGNPYPPLPVPFLNSLTSPSSDWAPSPGADPALSSGAEQGKGLCQLSVSDAAKVSN